MTRPILLMLLAMSLIPAGDGAGKILTSQMGVAPLFVSFSRMAIGAICVLPFMIWSNWALFRDPWVWARGILTGLGISCIVTSMQTLDLATAFGGLFFAPIVSFITATVFLKEPVTQARTALVVAGFIGVLLVAQPGGNFSAGTGYSLAAGICYGLFLTVSRFTAPNYRPAPLLFSQLIIAAVLLAPFGLSNLPTFDGAVTAHVLMSALFSMTGNLLLIMAYARAPATRLAPLIYFQLAAALVMGWVIFAQVPNGLALIGLFVIAASGFASACLRR